MRQQNGQNGRHHRGRGRHGNGGGSQGNGNHGGGQGGGMRRPQQVPLRNQNFDSHGPEGTRVRGNAFQVYEKYMALAREAGERIDAENYYQHAEHYYRIVEAIQEHEAEQRARYAAEQPAGAGGADAPPAAADPFGPTEGDSGLTDLAGAEQPQIAAQ
jgi:hypothetical protein